MAMTEDRQGLPQVDDPETVRIEWLRDLHDLTSQIKGLGRAGRMADSVGLQTAP